MPKTREDRRRRRARPGKVERAGFRVLHVTSFVSLLFPALLLSRLRRPKSPDNIDPTRKLRLCPAVNGALEQVMTVERPMIRLGLSMPVGVAPTRGDAGLT